ncbi:hypothetical protein F4819DRAFT_487401 [Hypoxylon fuscum]|nr:hypothetical protein F4819DRAFT_487401 [Hypoxylon fuscum]
MESRFSVVPIIAVVLHDETSNWILSHYAGDHRSLHEEDFEHDEDFNHDEDFKYDGDFQYDGDFGKNEGSENDEDPGHDDYQIAGFLMPYAGRSLDLLNATAVDSDKSPNSSSPLQALGSSTTTNLPINEEQLLDLTCGIRNLSKCGITHGDICYWNVVITEPELTASHAARLLLIDMGDVAPDYENDADALENLFLWCLEHSTRLKDNKRARKRIVTAAVLLKGGDLDRTIGVLSPSNASSLKRSFSSTDKDVKRMRT